MIARCGLLAGILLLVSVAPTFGCDRVPDEDVPAATSAGPLDGSPATAWTPATEPVRAAAELSKIPSRPDLTAYRPASSPTTCCETRGGSPRTRAASLQTQGVRLQV